jgi:replicative DNA helicase
MSSDDHPNKMIPANLEAEEAVLGSLLIDPDAILKVGALLTAEDFYREKHGWIYQAALELHERREAVDFVTLCDELRRREQLAEVGGAAYITALINIVPSALYVEHYARIVERTAVLRRLISAAGRIAALAYEGTESADDAVDLAEQEIFSISKRRDRRDLMPIVSKMKQVIDRIEYLQQHQGDLLGVPTGFKDLDKVLAGLQRSDLIIVAGRPGMGKSSLAVNIALHAAKQHRLHVGIFSLEMSSEQLIQRLLSSETDIDSQRLRLGDFDVNQWPRLLEAGSVLADTPIYIDDTPALNVLEMRTKARRLHEDQGLDLLIVDYLQLMHSHIRLENRVQEITAISRSLKELARELEIPLIAISQLSRAVESRTDKHPQLADLRESGALEQDADVVIFVYRDDAYYDEDKWFSQPGTKDKPYPKNVAEIIVAKHRHGPTAKIELYFRKEQTKFVELVKRPVESYDEYAVPPEA